MTGLPRYTWRLAPREDFPVGPEGDRPPPLPRPLLRALRARGLSRPDQVRAFFRPRLDALEDPFTLRGMGEAVDRIWQAIAGREKIAVFADFDADGVSSAALLTAVLRRLGAEVAPFLPRRFPEGYGMTPAALDRCLAECAPALIVTADCGIAAVDEVRRATARGVDVVVTDHHEPGPRPPPARAVVNPRYDDRPATRHLAGVGVAFKLCHALVKRGRERGEARSETLDLREWLDRVALGTVADVVPLNGENRILVAAGLQRLRRNPSPGLKALMRCVGIESPPGSHHLGFLLGPRVNAAGRMTSAEEALELLLCEDEARAMRLAAGLDVLNRRRRGVEKEILSQAEPMLTGFDPLRHGALVVGGTDWHPGVVGIVAARLAERFNRPAAVVALEADGRGRGSIRSAAGVDVLRALHACGDCIGGGGGHPAAAGFSLRAGALDRLRESFAHACMRQIPNPRAKPDLWLDGELAPGEVTRELRDALEALEPCGEGNPVPRWACRGLRLGEPPRRMGGEGAHLRLNLYAPAGGASFEAVGFHLGACAEFLRPSMDLAVAFELHLNRFRGRERLQLRLLDIHPDPGTAPFDT